MGKTEGWAFVYIGFILEEEGWITVLPCSDAEPVTVSIY